MSWTSEAVSPDSEAFSGLSEDKASGLPTRDADFRGPPLRGEPGIPENA